MGDRAWVLSWEDRQLGMDLGGMMEDTAGGTERGTGGTSVVVGTFLVGIFQSTVAAASLNSWVGIWPHTSVHT